MRKIYIVPNFVTTLGMFCGFYALVACVKYDFVSAAKAIGLAAVFDSLDGRIARLARATSSFGVEYDSLSDLISFGVAPAMLIYTWSLEPFGRLGWLAAFLFLACGALRLARFNVTAQSIPKSHFQGLPIPMGALSVASFVIFNDVTNFPGASSERSTQVFTLVLCLALSSLMISTIPFPSFKELNWRSKTSFGYLMIGVLSIVLIAAQPEIALFLLFMAYILASLLVFAWRSLKKSQPQAERTLKVPESK